MLPRMTLVSNSVRRLRYHMDITDKKIANDNESESSSDSSVFDDEGMYTTSI